MGDVSTVGTGVRVPSLGPIVAPWPVRSAKRCLFGTPDPEELRIHLEKETEKLRERDKKKWNFDFAVELPLDCGQYCWKKVRRDDDHSDSVKSGSSTENSSCEDIAMVQTHITDFMRKRKLSSSTQLTSSKVDSKAKRRFST